MMGIKKGDKVKVITGRDRGKEGRVISVDQERNRLLVEHVNIVKKHLRPNPSRNIKGGIAERESSIHYSNVMLVCPTCGPVRPKIQEDAHGNRTRVCRKCGNTTWGGTS